MSEPIVAVLEEEWQAISELMADFTDAEWDMPTALPGWSVKDNISHISGTELMFAGEPAPVVDISHLTYLTGPFPEAMEVWVEARRPLTGEAVCAEFEAVRSRRVEELRAMSDDAMGTVGWSPIGEVPYRLFMRVRVFDCFMHEQDIRRALDRPGHLEGGPVNVALERFEGALGFIVGKLAGATDGSSVVFVVTGPGETTRTYSVVVDGRAQLVADAPSDPTARITMPLPSYLALGGGRWTADEARAAGGITIDGDDDLANRVLDHMAFTP